MSDKTLLKEMGERINITRKSLKMTQEELAEKMDVSIQMISNLELGKKAIRPENIIKLCNVLDVSADYILRGTCSDFEMSKLMEKYKKLPTSKQELIEKIIENMQ